MNDLRENGRVILAHGEVTGHMHEVVEPDTGSPPDMRRAQFFEDGGVRHLVVLGDAPLRLQHEEHGAIVLDPAKPEQVRQGDVLLHPIGPGEWRVIRQQEMLGDAWRPVAD